MELECYNTKLPFNYGTTNLSSFCRQPKRLDGGVVMLCDSGSCKIKIGLAEYRMVKNAEVTILPNVTTSVNEISKDFSARFFTFSNEIYTQVILRLGATFSRFLRETSYYIHDEQSVLLQNMNVWFLMAEMIYKERDNQFIRNMELNFVQNYFFYLYDKCQLYFKQIRGNYSRKQELYHQFLSLVDKHCRDERNVDYYANRLCITTRYLRKITSENSGNNSPKEIIDKRIIVEAKVLLHQLDLSIQQVTNQLGFPDQSYFSRFFKSHTGVTPTTYRNDFRNKY